MVVLGAHQFAFQVKLVAERLVLRLERRLFLQAAECRPELPGERDGKLRSSESEPPVRRDRVQVHEAEHVVLEHDRGA